MKINDYKKDQIGVVLVLTDMVSFWYLPGRVMGIDMKKTTANKDENQGQINYKLIVFHIELPAEKISALEADAKRSGRSRRAHAAQLLIEVLDRGGTDFLFPRSQAASA